MIANLRFLSPSRSGVDAATQTGNSAFYFLLSVCHVAKKDYLSLSNAECRRMNDYYHHSDFCAICYSSGYGEIFLFTIE